MLRLTRVSILNRVSTRLVNTQAFNDAVSIIRTDLKSNIRSKGDVMEKNVIRSILSEVKNLEIKNNNKTDNDKYQLFELLYKMVKERKNTAAEYLVPGAPERFQELGEKELKECQYIEKYLTQLGLISEEQVELKLKEVIQQVEAEGLEVNLKNVYKKIPLKQIEKEWNCSRLQIKEVLTRLLN